MVQVLLYVANRVVMVAKNKTRDLLLERFVLLFQR